MRIFVTGTRGIPQIVGGIESHCDELYPRLVKLGCKVFVARRRGYAKDRCTEYKGVDIVDINVPRNKYAETIFHTFLSIIEAKRRKADIVHLHAVGPALLCPMVKGLGMKVVMTHHGADYERDKWGRKSKWFLKLGERIGMKWADEVIVISEVIKKMVESKYGRTDCHLIYNGVKGAEVCDFPEYFKRLDIEKNEYILSMSRIVPSKRLEDLIEAYAQAKKKVGDGNSCKLVIAGDCDFVDDYSTNIKGMAKAQGAVLTGYVSGKEWKALMANAKGFVLASNYEGKAISLLEAMSYHLRIIVSDIPANLEIGLNQNCYFHTEDVKELAEKLANVMVSDPKRVNYDMSRYNWDDIAKQTWTVYQEALAE